MLYTNAAHDVCLVSGCSDQWEHKQRSGAGKVGINTMATTSLPTYPTCYISPLYLLRCLFQPSGAVLGDAYSVGVVPTGTKAALWPIQGVWPSLA